MSHRPETPRSVLFGITLLAALALPAQALAEYYIPPGNSAANQYTEAYPTAGGDSGGKQGKGRATPADTLGTANAKRLESKGQTGAEVAAVAAETAPPPIAEQPGGGSDKGDGPGQTGGANGGGGSEPSRTAPTDSTSGSSAIGEVVAQATGSADDGNLGPLLPIVVLATVAGSIAYLARRHRTGPTA
jgi:hypothetical protein